MTQDKSPIALIAVNDKVSSPKRASPKWGLPYHAEDTAKSVLGVAPTDNA